MLYGGIEAGGTKVVCAVGTSELDVIKKETIPTTTPQETMEKIVLFFGEFREDLQSFGVGSFGPIDIDVTSSTYGYITSTPKEAWQNFNFVGKLKEHFNIPIFWTTDVNAAAYGEYVAGHGVSLDSVVYYTVGTGFGGGALQNGRFIEGFSHPEMGHMLVCSHSDDQFKGVCPFHSHCLEGFASGSAIEKRFGKKGQDLEIDNPFWDIEAYYIAQCAYNTTLFLSPDVIIFGGGVMEQQQLLPKVRKEFDKLSNNYVKTPGLESYIVTPKLGGNAATIGCLALAIETKLGK